MSAERKRFDKKWKGRAYPEVIAEDVAKLKARNAASVSESFISTSALFVSFSAEASSALARRRADPSPPRRGISG